MSDDLKLERLFDASPEVVFGGFTACRPAMTIPDGSSVDTGMEDTFREDEGKTRMMIVQGGFPAAGAWDAFAGGCPSILHGPGRAVAARVTDRS